MIRRQIVIPATPGRLWDALTDPGLLRGWFGGEIEWELREGSPLHFRSDEGIDREGRLDEVRTESRLRFVWWPEGEPDEASEVSYLIEPLGDGVRLTVQERPVRELPLGSSAEPPKAQEATSQVLSSAMAPAQVDGPHWTAWDTRLAGAWAGVAEVRARI